MHTSVLDGLGSTVPQRGARANAHHPLPVGGGLGGELFLHRVRVGHPRTVPRPGRTSRKAAEVRSRFSLSAVRVSASAVLFILKVCHGRHYSRCVFGTIRPPQ
jgi:hypothetical protein